MGLPEVRNTGQRRRLQCLALAVWSFCSSYVLESRIIFGISARQWPETPMQTHDTAWELAVYKVHNGGEKPGRDRVKSGQMPSITWENADEGRTRRGFVDAASTAWTWCTHTTHTSHTTTLYHARSWQQWEKSKTREAGGFWRDPARPVAQSALLRVCSSAVQGTALADMDDGNEIMELRRRRLQPALGLVLAHARRHSRFLCHGCFTAGVPIGMYYRSEAAQLMALSRSDGI